MQHLNIQIDYSSSYIRRQSELLTPLPNYHNYMIKSKWNKFGRKQPWPTVRFYEGITKNNEKT